MGHNGFRVLRDRAITERNSSFGIGVSGIDGHEPEPGQAAQQEHNVCGVIPGHVNNDDIVIRVVAK